MFTFSQIPFLEELKSQLIQMAKNTHVPGTVLFSGHNGSASLALAISLARYMACDINGNDSCGTCTSCKQFEHGNYPDIHYVFPFSKVSSSKTSCNELTEDFTAAFKSQPYLTEEGWQSYLESGNKQFIIPVSESELISSRLAVKPFSTKPRFFIIWLPEHLHVKAGNKLLKSLEEPGENTFFLLVSNHPERLLGTLKSRCVNFMVSRYSDSELANILDNKAAQSKINAAILDAEGSLGKAQRSLGQNQHREQLSVLFVDWVRLLYSRRIDGILNWTEDASRLYREDIKQFLDFSSKLFRQASLQNTGSSNHSFQFENFDLNKFRIYINQGSERGMLDLIENAKIDITRNGNPKIVLLDLSLRLFKYIG